MDKNSLYECELGCGRKFLTQPEMLDHVKRRHKDKQINIISSKVGDLETLSIKSGQGKNLVQPNLKFPPNKLRTILRPKLPGLPVKTITSNQQQEGQFDSQDDQIFRDSRIDFLKMHQKINSKQPSQDNLSQISLNSQRVSIPKEKQIRSSSNNKKEQLPRQGFKIKEQQNVIFTTNQIKRPSSSQIFTANKVFSTKTDEVPENQKICGKANNYTTSDILENKKKLSKKLFFQHGGYEQLDQITHLFLREKELLVFESTIEVPFNSLISLKSLTLSHNNLINVIGITQLHSLIELNINNNQINDLSPINACKMLQHLWANHNFIESIQNIGVMIHLETIAIGFNRIKSFDEITKMIKQLPSLKELEIQGNPCAQRHEYKYDLLWATFLERLDGIDIVEQDYLLAKAFKDGKCETNYQSKSLTQQRPITAPRIYQSEADEYGGETEIDDHSSFQSEQSGNSRENAIEEAYIMNQQLRDRIEKLEEQNFLLRRDVESLPLLQEEVFELRNKISSYETLTILKDSPEAEFRGQFLTICEELEKLKKENQLLKQENNELLDDDQKQMKSQLRATNSTQMNQEGVNKFQRDKETFSDEESNDEKYFQDDDNEANTNSQELMELLMRNSLTLSQMKGDFQQFRKPQ